jgi:hypothetical protein
VKSLEPEGQEATAGPSPPILGPLLGGREASFAFRPGPSPSQPIIAFVEVHLTLHASGLITIAGTNLHHHGPPSGLIITAS